MLLSPLDRQASEPELIAQALTRIQSSPWYRWYLFASSLLSFSLLVWLLFLRSDETTLIVRLLEASLISGLSLEIIKACGSVPFATIRGLVSVREVRGDLALVSLSLFLFLTSALTDFGFGDSGKWLSISWLIPYWLRSTTLAVRTWGGPQTDVRFVELQDARL